MESPTYNRYSRAFKYEVLDAVESGKMTMNEARHRYMIAAPTLRRWIKSFGKNHLLGRMVRVETLEERDRMKALEAEKKRLESALAQSQLKVMALEELIHVAEEEYKIDIKKNSGRG